MASIKLTDQFGLDVDAQIAPASALLKYFQQLPTLRLDTLDLTKVGGLTLDQPAIRSLRTGVSFQNPVSLGEGGPASGAPALSVGAGAHASIRLITSANELPELGGAMEMQPDTCYVAFGIEATVSANIAIPAGGVRFGASPSTKLEMVSYSRFPLHAGVTLLQALPQTVASFSIPVRTGDLADLPMGHMTTVAVSGKLTVSGSVDLLANSNPLASAALPAPLPTVSVSAGGSVTVGAACEIETEFEMVARKLETGAVRLGWRRKSGSQVTVRVQASEGITAGFGSTDLFSLVVRAISADAQADLTELASAGVPDGQALEIQSAVKAAVSRKLEIAIGAELTAGSSHAEMFLYDIVPGALTGESQNAVDQALRGDLGGLHAGPLPGVSPVRSIWDNLSKHSVELDINLLGILNYRSIATLSLEGKVMYEPATGSLVITDTATAERIRSTQVNFGADTQKLRHVLAESFLITAAYQGAGHLRGAASLRSSHSFFELQNSTSPGDMARKLRTGVALGLLSGEEAELPASVADFGRTLFMASTEYDDALVSRMFLDSHGSPLPHAVYEAAGRHAIQFLVQAGDDDAVRRQPAIDDGLWRQMSEVGQPGFQALFPGVPAPLVGAIAADYSTIQWWADAMQRTAHELARSRQWIERHPAASFQDPEFQKLREDLAGHLRQVAAATREEFGQPWGLLAMNQLAGDKAGARILIAGPTLARNKRRALTGSARISGT